ncbi:hypothetical protein ASZ78_013128 [Callipepla squamata]|uniref:Uncharacterized protein n=1 Tax=Callipepla squamata TaxID=9009 RepID=A0A226MAG3_CALSU|nr:hypothetical protein ASZ78_013128 [Callipepla squamata]
MPRLLTLQAAHDSASAADAPQGMLGNCATRPKAEGQVPAPADSQTTDVQAVRQTSEEIPEGETAESGDLQSPSDEAEADTACSASLPDAHPTPAGHPEPLQDPRETARDAYGNPPIHPAIRRIREEDRRERMLPSWNTSWRRDVRSPTLRRLLSRGDAFSTAGIVDSILGTWPSRTRVRIRQRRVHRRWSPRLLAVLEEISDDNDSAAGSARDMQDAEDTAVTNEGVQDAKGTAVTEDADPQHEPAVQNSDCSRQYQATRRPPGNACNIGPGAGNEGC